MLIAWLSLAFAQDEVCSPQPLSRWLAELDAAEAAMADLRLDDAVALLTDAHEVVRCLSDVVPVEGMQRYAQLRTLQSFYQQDDFMLETWAALALTTDGGVPWPVPDTHPVHRFLQDVVLVAAQAVEGMVFAPPKRGGTFVDGRWMPMPVAVPHTYHLVQVFDGDGERVAAQWQDGAGFDPALLTEGPPPLPPRWFRGAGLVEGPEVEELPTWRLARKDNVKVYERYLKRDPTGEHAAEARRRIDDLTWEATEKSVAGATAYLSRFPAGRNAGAAEGVLQGAEFKAALDLGTTEALHLFLGRYPDGVYAAAARRQLDERAWVEVLMEGTEQSYARYRVRWPKGVHVEEARIAQDDLAWEAADGKGRRAVEGYLQSWPTGGHATEARAYLDGLTFRTVVVTVSGDGPEEALLQARAVVVEELGLSGFEVVESEGQATLQIQVDALPLGTDLSRWIATVTVNVARSSEPLTSQELLLDPAPVRQALMDLDEALRPAIRRLAKFRRR